MAEHQGFKQSMDKARNKTTGEDMEVTTKIPAGAEGAIKTFANPDDIGKVFNDDMKTGDYEAAPQIFSLAEGQVIEGFLEGNGAVAEFRKFNKNTGEETVTEVKTWVIAIAGGAVRLSILSSAQLDRKLLGFVGSNVKIARGKDARLPNGNMMTEYTVWGPRLPNGARRQWFDAPQLPTGHQHALPASTGTGNHAS